MVVLLTIREQTEELELQVFSRYASMSRYSAGRERPEQPCDIRTCYQRDRDRILHSKSFRRLKHKTQVFLLPEGDHYRTRLTHTLEVAQLSRTIAKALRLNEDLADAIALGHDLGHTPFGHAGERALDQVCPYGFSHVEQSIRVVELLEKDGQGLNLTREVRDGIRNHRTSGNPGTPEGQIVRFCDKIAYLNHDIDDALRAGVLQEGEIPEACTKVLGNTSGERLNVLIHDVVESSLDRDKITMSAEKTETMRLLRSFMFRSVYSSPVAKQEEDKAIRVIRELYEYYYQHPELLPEEYQYLMRDREEPRARVVCDYISGMTDQYSMRKYTELFIPKSWQI